MLIEFGVSNFRSFRNKQVLSMVAGPDRAHPTNLIQTGDLRLMKAVAVYGANASGKSNLVKALGLVESFVRGSATSMNQGDPIPGMEEFRLDPALQGSPSAFQATVKIEGTVYEYSFSADTSRVFEESLFVKSPKGRRTKWLDRRFDHKLEKEEWKFGGPLRRESRLLREKTRSNGLVLSRGAEQNIPNLSELFLWFRSNLYVFDFSSDPHVLYQGSATTVREDPALARQVAELLKSADTGIDSVRIVEESLDLDRLPESAREVLTEEALRRMSESSSLSVRSSHILPGTEESVEFDFDSQESNGTRRLFALGGLCLGALENGWTVVIDEIDCSMHPLLTRKLIELFQSQEMNQKGAQLLFTTHDSTLMDPSLFRRDQIWLCEKTKNGSTELFSLHDFKVGSKPRSTEAFEKNYLAGRYGAVPQFGAALEDLELE